MCSLRYDIILLRPTNVALVAMSLFLFNPLSLSWRVETVVSKVCLLLRRFDPEREVVRKITFGLLSAEDESAKLVVQTRGGVFILKLGGHCKVLVRKKQAVHAFCALHVGSETCECIVRAAVSFVTLATVKGD